MAIQIIPTGGGTATNASISIPLTDLSSEGLLAEQMTNDASGVAASLWAFFEVIQGFDFATNGVLGLSKPATKSQTLTTVGLITEGFSLTIQKVFSRVSGTVSNVPIPSSGTNSGIGDIALTDIFPNAVKVAAAGAVAAEALLIPTSEIAVYDASIVHATLNLSTDSRGLLGAIYHYLADTLTLRTASVASAFLSSSVGSESITNLPSNYVSATNPLSDLVAADFTSGKKFLTSRTFSISLQTKQQTDNSFLVNAITA